MKDRVGSGEKEETTIVHTHMHTHILHMYIESYNTKNLRVASRWGIIEATVQH